MRSNDSPKKTLPQRERELQTLLATPEGRKELDDLAVRYSEAGGNVPARKRSIVTFILVYERENGLIGS